MNSLTETWLEGQYEELTNDDHKAIRNLMSTGAGRVLARYLRTMERSIYDGVLSEPATAEALAEMQGAGKVLIMILGLVEGVEVEETEEYE